jgi:hypothetical protein
VPRSARASILSGFNAAATIVEASEVAGTENGPCRPTTSEPGEDMARTGTAAPAELGEDVLASRLAAADAATSIGSSQHLDARSVPG